MATLRKYNNARMKCEMKRLGKLEKFNRAIFTSVQNKKIKKLESYGKLVIG